MLTKVGNNKFLKLITNFSKCSLKFPFNLNKIFRLNSVLYEAIVYPLAQQNNSP